MSTATLAPLAATAIDLSPVRQVLATMLYSPRATAAILDTITRTGSVRHGLAFLTEGDRRAIEAAIPATLIDPMPLRRDLVRVSFWMVEHDYDPFAIQLAIEDLRRSGTTAFSRYIDDEDRDTIEAMLDPSPDWNRREWDTIAVRLCEVG